MLSAQIDTVKRQLGALVISDARYAELQSLRPEQRSLADEVRLCMHDGLLQLRQENEALRVSAQVRAAARCAISTTWLGSHHATIAARTRPCFYRPATRRRAASRTRSPACVATTRACVPQQAMQPPPPTAMLARSPRASSASSATWSPPRWRRR